MEHTNWEEALARAWGSRVGAGHRLYWLMQQSILTSPQRSFALRLVPQDAIGRVLDVGCGVGALSFDLLQLGAAQVTALDQDEEAMQILGQAARDLGVLDRVTVVRGDACALPFKDHSFDLTVCRLLLQHLGDPATCLEEMARVTKPDGLVLVMDIDDGLNLTYPPWPRAVQRLYQELGQAQRGDRQIGRKLSSLMRQAGLSHIRVQVLPLLLDHVPRPDWATKAHLARLASDRELVLNAGRMSAATFDQAMAAIEASHREPRFELTAEFIALGRKPGHLSS